MKNRKVLHFVRKMLPATASFIRNQVVSHQRYQAKILYKQLVQSINSEDVLDNIDFVYLEDGKTGFSKLSSNFLYQKFRKLTAGDVDRCMLEIEHYKPSILHFHYGTDAGMFHQVINESSLPSVVSFYGYDCSSFPKRLMGYGKRFLQKKVFHQVTRVLAMSPDMKKDLLNLGCPEEKIIVHYYGTDTKRFFSKRKYNKKGAVNFLILCGLVPQKGHLLLLQAFQKATQLSDMSLKLHIVGDGQLRGEIDLYVRGKGMENVILHGPVRYGSKEHSRFFSEADIFIHPSVTAPDGAKEGIPGALIEAMSAGLPVISTYHAGIPYILKHGQTGLLVREWDVPGLADCIMMLARDDNMQKSLGKGGQAYAMENLDLVVKEQELEEIYDSLAVKE